MQRGEKELFEKSFLLPSLHSPLIFKTFGKGDWFKIFIYVIAVELSHGFCYLK
jgi:hypothetical protein